MAPQVAFRLVRCGYAEGRQGGTLALAVWLSWREWHKGIRGRGGGITCKRHNAGTMPFASLLLPEVESLPLAFSSLLNGHGGKIQQSAVIQPFVVALPMRGWPGLFGYAVGLSNDSLWVGFGVVARAVVGA